MHAFCRCLTLHAWLHGRAAGWEEMTQAAGAHVMLGFRAASAEALRREQSKMARSVFASSRIAPLAVTFGMLCASASLVVAKGSSSVPLHACRGHA
jgi:hypothetical protein